MRFRLDDEGNTWLPKLSHAKPDRETLTHKQRVEFLKLLHDGLGCTMACARLGIGVREMKQAIAASAGFRRAVRQIELVRAERMFALLYDAALNGDMKAAQFLLARHDRKVEQRKARRDTSS
ncbi:hypothetical protein [Singulisphaera sp. GP187]|uniref:hypothetical protein n=1 Tax=Singulisphaera sp. GP187 TaxID=1882752 RepID=UPI000941A2EC|nr:hypothetical protein [Singulisphaera sp. GP187]